MRGRLEIGSTKQAKGLLSNCGKILGNFEENRKVIISPTVRYYRAKCCEKEGHVSNLVEPGYRKGMLEDLAKIHEGLAESCREEGMRRYKMISPLDLLGISHQTEEDEVASLLGDSPVHMTRAGYALMAEKLTEMVEKKGAVFAGDKRRRDDSVTEEAVVEVGGWSRRTHEWLFSTVSGKGGWRGGRGPRGGMGRGRGGARGRGFP